MFTARVLVVGSGAEYRADRLSSGDSGLQAIAARTADAAYDRLEADDVACVVVDAALPDSDVVAFIATVSWKHPSIPLVLFTDDADGSLVESARDAGLTAYVHHVGDVAFDVLAERISSLVAHPLHAADGHELERSETAPTMNALFEASPDAIVLLDAEARVRLWNPAAERIFGWEASEVLGRFNPIVPADREGKFRELYDRILDGESVRDLELRRRRRNGEEIDVRLSTAPVRDVTGDVTGAMAVLQDISERKSYERALTQQNERIETIASNAPVILFALDSDGVITFSRGRGLECIGLRPDEAIGQSVYALFGDSTQLLDCIECALNGERVHDEVQIDDAAFDTWCRPVFREAGAVERVIGVAINVTDRHEYERVLQERNEQLAERTHQLELLNTLLRHEVLNGMAVIRGYLEVLERGVEDDDLSSAVSRLDSRSTDVVDVVQRVRRVIGRLTREDIDLEPVDVASVLEARVERLRETYPGADVTLDAPAGAAVMGDDLLGDVLHNVLVNAVEHNDGDRARVEVSVDVGPDVTSVTVADDGPGVPPDVRDEVFSRNGPSRVGPGGFGLYFVDTMVSKYGGDIWVTDSTMSGAEFVVELPTVT